MASLGRDDRYRSRGRRATWERERGRHVPQCTLLLSRWFGKKQCACSQAKKGKGGWFNGFFFKANASCVTGDFHACWARFIIEMVTFFLSLLYLSSSFVSWLGSRRTIREREEYRNNGRRRGAIRKRYSMVWLLVSVTSLTSLRRGGGQFLRSISPRSFPSRSPLCKKSPYILSQIRRFKKKCSFPLRCLHGAGWGEMYPRRGGSSSM